MWVPTAVKSRIYCPAQVQIEDGRELWGIEERLCPHTSEWHQEWRACLSENRIAAEQVHSNCLMLAL